MYDHLDAIVLAGGINRIPLYDGYEPGYKALVPIAGRPSILYTLDALRGTPQVGRIGVVGDEALLRQAMDEDDRQGRPSHRPEALEFVAGGATLLESFAAGLRHFAGSPAVLVITADIPLVTVATLARFLSACSAVVETQYGENLMLLVVPESSYVGAYAGCPKAVNRFRDVTVCHGNVFLADPRLLDNAGAMARIDPLYSARKNPVAAALAVGLRVGLSYVLGVHLLHALSLRRMAAIASRRFGIGIVPVLADCPEATVDIDSAADYQFVCRRLDELA